MTVVRYQLFPQKPPGQGGEGGGGGEADSKVLGAYDRVVFNKLLLSLRGSTIGEGGDTTISSPGRSPKQLLPGMRLHGPLHGRQACPKFIAFDEGVGQICPR